MKKKEILIFVIAIATIVLTLGASVLAGGFIIHAFGNYVGNLLDRGFDLSEFKCFVASIVIHVIFIAWAVIEKMIEHRKMKG